MWKCNTKLKGKRLFGKCTFKSQIKRGKYFFFWFSGLFLVTADSI